MIQLVLHIKMKNKIKCPLCGSDAPHKEINKVHVWMCNDCPFTALEFHTSNNLKKLAEHYDELELELLLK